MGLVIAHFLGSSTLEKGHGTCISGPPTDDRSVPAFVISLLFLSATEFSVADYNLTPYAVVVVVVVVSAKFQNGITFERLEIST